MKWNIWNFTHVMRSHLVRYLVLYTWSCKMQRVFYRIPLGKIFTTSVKIHEGFSSAKFFHFKYMFIVLKSKWTQKFVFFLISSACKQKPSIIWGKELEVFLFMFKWSFICLIMTCINVPSCAFKYNWLGF